MTPRLLLAGLAVLVAAGCGGGGGSVEAPKEPKLSAEAQKALDEVSPGPRPPDDVADIERLLHERVQALERRDVGAYVATGAGAQRKLDRRSARRAVRMSIERVELLPDDLEVSGNRADVKVAMSYRVRGMRRPFLTGRRMEIRRTRNDWRVTRDVARAEPLPWEVAPFRVTRAPHIVLLTPPGVDPAPLRDGLVAAYRDIRRDLPARDLPRSVLVIGARDASQTERLAGRIANGIIALANVRVTYGPGPAFPVERVLAQRLIVVNSRWSPLPPHERQATLVHEMTHTALDPDASGSTPAWLAEGVAMHVAGENRAGEARARAAGAGPSVRLRDICRDGSIFRLDGDTQGGAYAAASGAAEAIVAQHGTKGLFRLYDAFNEQRYAGRTCTARADRVMRGTLGMSLRELEAAVGG